MGWRRSTAAFHKVPSQVVRVMHMCCGYPNHLDDEVYHKADQNCYFQLADAVDRTSVQQISIEDAHRHNDLSLLEQFPRSTIIFGAVAVAKSRVEEVEEIVERLRAALGHIDRERLMAAPDCGLGLLGRDLAVCQAGTAQRCCEGGVMSSANTSAIRAVACAALLPTTLKDRCARLWAAIVFNAARPPATTLLPRKVMGTG